MEPRDTTERAARIRAARDEVLDPAARLRQVVEVSEFAREFAKAALRKRYPELSEPELMRRLTSQLHGTDERHV